MKIQYFPDTDTLYIELSPTKFTKRATWMKIPSWTGC